MARAIGTMLILTCLAGCVQTTTGLEQRAFNRAMGGSPEERRAFLTQYPNSPLAQRVRAKDEEVQRAVDDVPVYEPYKKIDTIAAYQEFIARYPRNTYVSKAKDRIADLEFEEYKQRNTIEAYEEFLARYPQHRWRQQAAETLAALRGSPKGQVSTEVIVVTGSLAQPHEKLGEVHTDTTDLFPRTSFLLFRSLPSGALPSEAPKLSYAQMDERLRQKARTEYGSRVDAVINVTYRADPDGNIFASGLAVHLVRPAPATPSEATLTRSTGDQQNESPPMVGVPSKAPAPLGQVLEIPSQTRE